MLKMVIKIKNEASPGRLGRAFNSSREEFFTLITEEEYTSELRGAILGARRRSRPAPAPLEAEEDVLNRLLVMGQFESSLTRQSQRRS